MRSFLFIPLFCLFALVSSYKVVNLSSADFDSFIAENPKTLVTFSAPWCGHCRNIVPALKSLAEIVGPDGVAVATVDITQHEALSKKFGIMFLPTLLWFSDGQAPIPCKAGRSASQMASWIRSKLQNIVKRISQFEAIPQPIFPKFNLIMKGPNVTEPFIKIASRFEGFANSFFVDSVDYEVLIHHPNEEPIQMASSGTDEIEAFVKANKFPLWGLVDSSNFSQYKSEKSKALVVILFKSEDSQSLLRQINENRPWVTSLAKEFPGFSFAYSDTFKEGGSVKKQLAVERYPAVVALKQGRRKKAVLYDDITEDSVRRFITDIRSKE